MPWRTSSAMSQRHEFVMLASQEQSNIRQLCGRFGIGPATAYKWLHRYEAQGCPGLEELSHRPQHLACPLLIHSQIAGFQTSRKMSIVPPQTMPSSLASSAVSEK
ncbi:MAG: helix-turn-helix domain-containing protein [Blastocatellia bacterium]|nr:helix-turn-helix domain-containing protein [Blastocatellia bacterium]